MSSGFVSAGGEEVKPRDGLSGYDKDAWEKARQKIEELKKPKPDAPGTQEGGKSLYEHLQAQKAAKQEAFEEATKLRNQFRPLDDSEVAFLESVKSKEGAKARAERQETQEQLAAFRREREAAEEEARELEAAQEALRGGNETPSETWTATKKRRRAKGDEKIATSKSLKTSTMVEEFKSVVKSDKVVEPASQKTTEQPAVSAGTLAATRESPAAPKAETMATILVSYDSDSDD